MTDRDDRPGRESWESNQHVKRWEASVTLRQIKQFFSWVFGKEKK